MDSVRIRVESGKIICLDLFTRTNMGYDGGKETYVYTLAKLLFEYDLHAQKIKLKPPFETHSAFDERKDQCRESLKKWLPEYSKKYDVKNDIEMFDINFISSNLLQIDLYLNRNGALNFVCTLAKLHFDYDDKTNKFHMHQFFDVHEIFAEKNEQCIKALNKWADALSKGHQRNHLTSQPKVIDLRATGRLEGTGNIYWSPYGRKQLGIIKRCSNCNKQNDCPDKYKNPDYPYTGCWTPSTMGTSREND